MYIPDLSKKDYYNEPRTLDKNEEPIDVQSFDTDFLTVYAYFTGLETYLSSVADSQNRTITAASYKSTVNNYLQTLEMSPARIKKCLDLLMAMDVITHEIHGMYYISSNREQ